MDNQHLSIVGHSNNRVPYDFYPTPPEATAALLKLENFEGRTWECASGNGSMSKVLEEHGLSCYSSDIRDDDSVYGTRGFDFLNDTKHLSTNRFENIITNPPYKYATEFVLISKQLAKNKIAMLLKLAFLEGMKRYDVLFQDTEFPLKTVYVFSKRLQFSPNGKSAGSPTIASAWFVWDKSHVGPPQIQWIRDLT